MNLTNFTIYGKCSNCGQCCSDILHLSKEEIKTIKDYLKVHKLEQCNKGENNLNCPFRDDFMKKCNIYEVRPEICRVFKCNKTSEDAFLTREFTNLNKDPISMAETFFNDNSKLKFLIKYLGGNQ